MMKLLSAVHRWTGGFLGFLLALLGLTGAILVWEGYWVQLPGADDRLAENVQSIAAIGNRAAAQGEISRITFASEELGLHQVTYANGGGAYVRQTGEVVDRWSSEWQRPELWLFDLHHHLFMGETGETLTGLAGVAGLLFVITGMFLWWRSRRNFRLRLWPKRLAPGPIVAHHRDLGIVTAPLLLLSLATGVLMIFDDAREFVLGKELRPKEAMQATASSHALISMLERAKARFPNAQLRRISLPREPGQPLTIRLRQPSEWTPNGRTQLTFDARTGALLGVEDALNSNRAAFISEKLYPVHSAKVGRLGLKLLMSLSGLVLFALGAFTTYSFWGRRAAKRLNSPSRRALASA